MLSTKSNIFLLHQLKNSSTIFKRIKDFFCLLFGCSGDLLRSYISFQEFDWEYFQENKSESFITICKSILEGVNFTKKRKGKLKYYSKE